MLHRAGRTFVLQHGDDAFGRVVAEQLAAVLLMEGDAVAAHQGDEVLRREARQRGPAEGRVAGNEVRGAAVDVGEVAAPAAGDADLLAHFGRVVEQQHAQAALPGDAGTEQPGGARAQHDDIEFMHV